MPEFGVVRLLSQTRNQDGVLVMEMTTVVLVQRKAKPIKTPPSPQEPLK
jgi:hypothetical protein